MTNPSTTWSGVIFLNHYVTYFVQQIQSLLNHDNPAVKSIVILRIPKYNVLTYKKRANQCNKTISLDIFWVQKP